MSHLLQLTSSESAAGGHSQDIPMMERSPLNLPPATSFGSFPPTPNYHSVIEQVPISFHTHQPMQNIGLKNTIMSFSSSVLDQERDGTQRISSIASLYPPGQSHSVTMRTTSLSSDEDMLDITTHGTTQVSVFFESSNRSHSFIKNLKSLNTNLGTRVV